MLYNAYDANADYAYGSGDVEPINWAEEPYTFWSLVDECGEDYARSHSDVVIEAMEQFHFFHNAKSTERAAANKFWSLSHDERVNILYDYFNEEIDYWENELKKENNQ